MDEQSAPPPGDRPDDRSGAQTGNQTGSGTGSQTGTTDAPGPQTGPRVSGEQMRDVQRLRRSRSDRYIAGVAGGLGRHFDVDPTIVRVLLAVLTFFGGAGVLVYGVVWLFVPEDGEDRAPIDLNPDIVKIVLVVTGAVALMIVFGTPFFGDSWGFAFPIPLLVLGLVVLAVFATRDQRRRPAPVPPPPWGSGPPPGTPGTPGTAGPSAGPQEGSTMTTTAATTAPVGQPGQQPPAWLPPTPPPYVPPPRPRRTGMVLFWPTLALIAIALGTLGIFDVNDTVLASAYAALAVAIIAAMLLVGAFVGRPGGLIALGLVGTLALGITGAVDSATDGHRGGEEVLEAPASSALVRDDYHVPNGSLTLDLRNVADLAALDGHRIEVSLNAGEIDVILPRGLNAMVEAQMHLAGDISIDGVHRGGFDQSMTRSITGATGPETPTITLDVDARFGQITVEQD